MRTTSVTRWALAAAVALIGIAGAADASAAPRRIVYTAPGSNADTDPDIWSIRPDGHGRRNLVPGPTYDRSPSWSPHHHHIVFAREAVGASQSMDDGIYVMRASGANVHRIFAPDPREQSAGEPVWSPNGRRIAFVFGTAKDGAAIATIRTDGSHFRRLTPWSFNYSHPSWAPGGRHIVYRGVQGIERIRSDGSHRRRLTNSGTNPDWSPDGGRIAFSANHRTRDGVVSDVVTIRPDGSDHRRITRHRPNLLCANEFTCQRLDIGPAWGPRGRRLVFSEGGYEGGQAWKLIVTRRDGTHPHALVKRRDLGSPEW
jgi:Tol biopolymer transport system component